MARHATVTGHMPFDVQVSAGFMPGWSVVVIVGHDLAAAQANAILSPGNAGGVIDPTALLGTPAVVSIASIDGTNADDATGTGANTILVTGLDGDGVPQTETISMHASVAQTAVAGLKTFSAVNSIRVATAGSLKHNLNTIWCGTGAFTTGVPAVGLASIEALHNNSLTGHYTVAANHELYIVTAQVGGDGSAAFKGLDFEVDLYSVGLGIELELFDLHLGDGGSLAFPAPFPRFIAGQQIRLRGGTIAQTGNLTFRTAAYLRDLSHANSWGP